jgi:hypothetical protein
LYKKQRIERNSPMNEYSASGISIYGFLFWQALKRTLLPLMPIFWVLEVTHKSFKEFIKIFIWFIKTFISVGVVIIKVTFEGLEEAIYRSIRFLKLREKSYLALDQSTIPKEHLLHSSRGMGVTDSTVQRRIDAELTKAENAPQPTLPQERLTLDLDASQILEEITPPDSYEERVQRLSACGITASIDEHSFSVRFEKTGREMVSRLVSLLKQSGVAVEAADPRCFLSNDNGYGKGGDYYFSSETKSVSYWDGAEIPYFGATLAEALTYRYLRGEIAAPLLVTGSLVNTVAASNQYLLLSPKGEGISLSLTCRESQTEVHMLHLPHPPLPVRAAKKVQLRAVA